MIIYNVTIKVDWSVHDQWLRWMKEEKLPGMLATPFFYEYRMVRLLETDDTDGPTYAVQYAAHSLKEYNRYITSHLIKHSQMEAGLWGNKAVHFSTVMEVVC